MRRDHDELDAAHTPRTAERLRDGLGLREREGAAAGADREGAHGATPASAGLKPRRTFSQHPGRHTSYQGPSSVSAGRVGSRHAVTAFEHEVDQPADERRVHTRRRNADREHPVLLGGLHGLGVEVPLHFHVIGDEAERHDDDRLHPALGELGESRR